MPALLVLPVLLAHIWLGVAVQGLQEGWGGAAAPPRLTVAYVRELIAQPPPTPAPRLKKLAAPAAAAAASLEPLVNPPEAAASAPENIEPLQALLPIVEPVAAAPVNPPASDAGVEWPPSTRLSYELTGNYRGPVNGNAQVEWIRQASRYQVHLDVSVGPSFAPLITRHMSSDGELTAAGIVPLAKSLGLPAPIVAERGQILVTERFRPFLRLPGSGIRQTADGTILMGTSKENVGLDDRTSVAVGGRIAARAIRILPELASARLNRTWGGIRVLTPDHHPVYAESEECPGAFVAICHSGVTLAAAHATDLAQAISAGSLGDYFAPFHARRFDVPKAA